MIRTQIYLTENEKRGLELTAKRTGVSQSDLIRQAIDELLSKVQKRNKLEVLEQASGIWAERHDLPDIPTLRKGWRNRER